MNKKVVRVGCVVCMIFALYLIFYETPVKHTVHWGKWPSYYWSWNNLYILDNNRWNGRSISPRESWGEEKKITKDWYTISEEYWRIWDDRQRREVAELVLSAATNKYRKLFPLTILFPIQKSFNVCVRTCEYTFDKYGNAEKHLTDYILIENLSYKEISKYKDEYYLEQSLGIGQQIEDSLRKKVFHLPYFHY